MIAKNFHSRCSYSTTLTFRVEPALSRIIRYCYWVVAADRNYGAQLNCVSELKDRIDIEAAVGLRIIVMFLIQ